VTDMSSFSPKSLHAEFSHRQSGRGSSYHRVKRTRSSGLHCVAQIPLDTFCGTSGTAELLTQTPASRRGDPWGTAPGGAALALDLKLRACAAQLG
jgi:hypothetical protein